MGRFISHVQLPARDVEEAIRWYEKVLGCTFIANYDDFAIVEFPEGPCIDLWRTDDRTTSNFTVNGAPFPTIGIQVEDLDELAATVIASGVDYEGDGTLHQDDEGNRFFRFFDPNGNMLVAHQLPAEVDDEEEQQLEV